MTNISPLLHHHHLHPLFHPAAINALVFTLFLTCFHSPQVSCSAQLHQQPAPPPSYPAKVVEGALSVEEKIRLGSTPPSCHNKCNSCHPCMAVQVPTQPSHTRVQPGSSQRVIDDTELYDSYYNPPAGNRYSNYKPLGWKCRCGDHLYNP